MISKKEQVKELQKAKNSLSLEIKKAFQEKHDLFITYNKLNNNWLDLKTEWEELDRKEKFLSLPITQAKRGKARSKSKIKSQSVKAQEIKAQAKEIALKSLEKLPLEIRKQVLANFKF